MSTQESLKSPQRYKFFWFWDVSRIRFAADTIEIKPAASSIQSRSFSRPPPPWWARPRCWRQVQFSRDGRYLNFGDTLGTFWGRVARKPQGVLKEASRRPQKVPACTQKASASTQKSRVVLTRQRKKTFTYLNTYVYHYPRILLVFSILYVAKLLAKIHGADLFSVRTKAIEFLTKFTTCVSSQQVVLCDTIKFHDLTPFGCLELNSRPSGVSEEIGCRIVWAQEFDPRNPWLGFRLKRFAIVWYNGVVMHFCEFKPADKRTRFWEISLY